jgi:proteasome lid subunit RPN8/RPN11
MKLALPVLLQNQIAGEAIAAYPRECCGLIEGLRVEGAAEGDGFRAVALHPARNLAAAADRFELDPADHIAALKAARARGHVLIGCYHSHPGGHAAPSPADQGGAAQADFVWLIAATDGAACRLAAFVYRAPGFDAVALCTSVGADLVTSSLNERS